MTEPRKKLTLPGFFKKAAEGIPITWLTCYDYPTAYLQEQAGCGYDPGGRQPGHDHARL